MSDAFRGAGLAASSSTRRLLLATTFLLGVGGALTSPAWDAITPLLVPRRDLDSAIAANSVGYQPQPRGRPGARRRRHRRRRLAAPFWVFASAISAVIAALIWWRPPQESVDSLPAERLTSAIRTGVRHAANNVNICARR